MGAPDFASQIDPNAYKIDNAQGLSDRLGQASKDIDSVHADYSQVNSLLAILQQQQGGMDARAQGQGLTAGDAAKYGQQDLGAAGSDPQSLGHALMRLGSKASAGQATQVAGAQEQQQMQAMAKAQQLKQAQAAARIQIYKQELQLQDTKAQMQRGVTQANDGLQLAQMQMRNMFNVAVSKARNAKDLADITIQRDQFNQVMSYLGMGLGAASAATAAGAAAYGQSQAATSDDASGTHLDYQYGGAGTGKAATYGGITNTGGTGGWGSSTPVTGSSTQSATSTFYNSGGNSRTG